MIEADEKTLWCGNLSEQVTEELLYELFMQAGPLNKVRIARDRDGRQRTFAFITYCHEVSVPYAINLFRGTALFHRTLHLQSRSQTTLLPPPIRSTSLDPSFDFLAQTNVKKQFAEMTEQLQDFDRKGLPSPRPCSDSNDDLIVASLQGNWSHRHHPYRNDDNNRRHKGHSFISLCHESHSTRVVFQLSSVVAVEAPPTHRPVSQVSATMFELVQPVINSDKGRSFIIKGRIEGFCNFLLA
ncbi:RNA-binding protein 7 [Eumeta japonica]|uniref:RNA-binding protein 7 n=1 Tax=Eumeta variegata TaxID=151549 RepID=A0A4C1SAZ9_EUMVA|nr:RNA-binding protein 7 [Eumeta japonica]